LIFGENEYSNYFVVTNLQEEKRSDEIYHNHLVKDFIGIEKIVSEYL